MSGKDAFVAGFVHIFIGRVAYELLSREREILTTYAKEARINFSALIRGVHISKTDFFFKY